MKILLIIVSIILTTHHLKNENSKNVEFPEFETNPLDLPYLDFYPPIINPPLVTDPNP